MAIRLPDEYHHEQEISKKAASSREKEYLNVKILAVLLIDIVRAENKDDIIKGLRELLQSGGMNRGYNDKL